MDTTAEKVSTKPDSKHLVTMFGEKRKPSLRKKGGAKTALTKKGLSVNDPQFDSENINPQQLKKKQSQLIAKKTGALKTQPSRLSQQAVAQN